LLRSDLRCFYARQTSPVNCSGITTADSGMQSPPSNIQRDNLQTVDESQPTSLNNLPTEIIHEIAEYLPATEQHLPRLSMYTKGTTYRKSLPEVRPIHSSRERMVRSQLGVFLYRQTIQGCRLPWEQDAKVLVWVCYVLYGEDFWNSGEDQGFCHVSQQNPVNPLSRDCH
jgi:hypothetical protein